MPVIGVQGVQTVHHVVRLPVGGGVAQGEQGVELAQALPSLAATRKLSGRWSMIRWFLPELNACMLIIMT